MLLKSRQSDHYLNPKGLCLLCALTHAVSVDASFKIPNWYLFACAALQFSSKAVCQEKAEKETIYLVSESYCKYISSQNDLINHDTLAINRLEQTNVDCQSLTELSNKVP